MMAKPVGVVVMATVFLFIGLASVMTFGLATEARAPGTSPLMQLFTSALSITFILGGLLMWRRSRLAPPVFVAALAFPVVISRFLVPSGKLFVPSLLAAAVIALAGYRYLQRETRRLV